MTLTGLRKELEGIRASAEAGDLGRVVEQVEHALQTLDGSYLLTTTEAARVLGIRSVNTLKLLIRRLGVAYELHGNRMMIPLAEIERIQNYPDVRGIRASDSANNVIDATGDGSELSAEELVALAQARPGRLPWQEQEDRES